MCEQDLAAAVIFQAEKDANLWKDNYHRQTARNFLCGSSAKWLESLEFWCTLAQIKPNVVLESSRRKWRPDLCKNNSR